MEPKQATVEIERGNAVLVRTYEGNQLPRLALTGVIAGHDFPVVWVCRPEEWEAATAEGRDPVGVPWPAEDVEVKAPGDASNEGAQPRP